MSELIKAFEKFLMRDLSYVTGGGAVILSFLYVFNRLPAESTPIVWYVPGVAFAYVLGYAIQDALALCHIIRMKAGHAPNKFASWLYKCYDRTPPQTFNKEEYDNGKFWLYTSAPQRFKDDHERTEGMKQVAFAIGPCLVISGILLLAKDCIANPSFDRAMSCVSIVVGAVLYVLGWLKVTQQAQYVLRHSRRAESPFKSVKGEAGFEDNK
jgi:hypothetical protein